MFLQACLFVSTACLLGFRACLLGFVLVVSRLVCTKHPDPMAGQPLDPDKPNCFTSCRGVEANPIISHLFFVDFCPDTPPPPPPTFAADFIII